MANTLAELKPPTGKQISAILADLLVVVNGGPPGPPTELIWARLAGLHAGLAGDARCPAYDLPAQDHYLRGYRVGSWFARGLGRREGYMTALANMREYRWTSDDTFIDFVGAIESQAPGEAE